MLLMCCDAHERYRLARGIDRICANLRSDCDGLSEKDPSARKIVFCKISKNDLLRLPACTDYHDGCPHAAMLCCAPFRSSALKLYA